MKPWMRRSLIALAAVVAVGAAGYAWLIHTNAGARFALRRAIAVTQGRLDIADVEGVLRGLYRYHAATEQRANKAQILASGVAMPSALKAAEMLAAEWDVAADVWSVTSWSELNRDGVALQKEALRHPDRPAGEAYVTKALSAATGPFVAVSDWMRAVPEQIR